MLSKYEGRVFPKAYSVLVICVLQVHQRTESADGYDMNFATNTLGGWALTKLLAPVLEKSSPSKVVFISSGA